MVKDFERDYYNQKNIWKNYDDNVDEINRAKKTIALIPGDVKSVLDIGCGNGIVTDMIKVPFVVGLDFARVPLSRVKANAIQASIDALPIKNHKFDLVILTEVLEHLDEETYTKAIKELKRLNARYYLITVPFKESLELDLCECSVCGNLFNSNHHYRKFDEKWFIKEFVGYSLERTEYASYQCFPNEKITKLKHNLGIYRYSDHAICNKCGNRPSPPKMILVRCVLGGINIFDLYLKSMLNIRKPYHQMILLKRKEKVLH